ncbi:MAG: TrkH family potassium uptake protein [Acidimicrobiia bacterium]|nr:TrkH family potassium uptake protein [Acidimicrobiia bacterium]
MIRVGALAYILGQFLIVLSACMLVPLAFSLWYQTDLRPLGFSFLLTGALGGACLLATRRPATDLNQREGLLFVVIVWVATSACGALPFYFSAHFPSFTDAFFESVSGFTTTGATVLPQVEVLPHDLQFWRCFSHWLGGMGIVLLAIAILPLLVTGGMRLYRAEFSGARSEKLKPRITETALALWKIYFALTLAEVLALRLAGMGTFDAVCHTFSTLGTGGFSTRTASIAAFDSPAIEAIVIVFMLLSGMSFTQHYRLWIERRPRVFFSDRELWLYLLVALGASVIIFLNLSLRDRVPSGTALRNSVFQVVSIMTTTGFVTDDFEKWLPLPQLILLALMFFGGCTGSTAGGLKSARILLLARVVNREFKRMVERRGVFAVRLGDQVMPENSIQSLLNLVYLAFLVNFVAALLLAADGVDVLTSISAVAATMFNVGPGLGSVGAAEHYGHLPAFTKWVLSGCMLAGRLEFYTILVILAPAFWRK